MTSLEAIAAAQGALEVTFAQKFSQLETAVKSASPPNIDSLSAELQHFKETTMAMVNAIRQQISALSNAVDNIEMRHRRKYLMFAGVQESDNENPADVVAALCRERLQLADVTSSSFSVCHRMSAVVEGRPRSILVRLNNPMLRQAIWQKKTAFKGTSIVLSEFLTRQRHSVFIDARKQYGMRNVWTADGTILVKTSNGKLHRVVTALQLEQLISRHPPPAPASSPAASIENLHSSADLNMGSSAPEGETKVGSSASEGEPKPPGSIHTVQKTDQGPKKGEKSARPPRKARTDASEPKPSTSRQ